MTTTIPPMAANGMKTRRTSQAYGGQARETKLLIAKLCHQFYNLGWVSGAGGSITVEVHDDSFPISDQLILMSPSGLSLSLYTVHTRVNMFISPENIHVVIVFRGNSGIFIESKNIKIRVFILGVQKERMVVDDMYVLSPNGSILFSPLPKPYPHKPQKSSDCAPLFMKAYDRGNAGAVIHSHGIKSYLVTMIDPLAKEFRAERYHYRSDAAINIHQLGLDPSISSHGPIQKPKGVFGRWKTNKSLKAGARTLDNDYGSTPHCVVLDIEGTTTPISFVTDVLFPYARDNVRMHLEETYDTADTKDDIKLLRSQIEDDLQKGVVGAVPVPLDEADKEGVIAALVANVEEMIKADRKITSLKQLQGHIWRTGFEKNELKGVVYDDVPKALERWHASGVKVYIYSSGSRLAQRLIFGYTNYGDLRKYLCGFFDTRVGNKRETKSYIEISESLGVDKPSDVLFVTDVIQEAVAAKAAGLEVMISVRPGNGPLPENHGFTTIESFTEIPF